MEFIFKATGSHLKTDNAFVIEQMEKNPSVYTKVVEKVVEPKKTIKKPAKAEE